ncbi:MAG: phosphoribosylformylglycinamidine cyclo-ligase, partial [Bacteroidia bacterium]|nr:phosphoribosylformylglycinamidine cyclo-ligase [Bacteroidia bacterium]MDW8333797.1 phosphoribosylformylglycinamidine cyclo-ligase [Bacteroidia bacterium]
MSDWYAARGVSADKTDVKRATLAHPPGLFPDAFCKIVPDFSDPDHCLVCHADGTGTKPVVAYLHWRETGDAAAWAGLVRDALAMNLDDM